MHRGRVTRWSCAPPYLPAMLSFDPRSLTRGHEKFPAGAVSTLRGPKFRPAPRGSVTRSASHRDRQRPSCDGRPKDGERRLSAYDRAPWFTLPATGTVRRASLPIDAVGTAALAGTATRVPPHRAASPVKGAWPQGCFSWGRGNRSAGPPGRDKNTRVGSRC